MWIDVHTHLDRLEWAPPQALEIAAQSQVEQVITIGTCPDDLSVVLALAKAHAPVSCTLGIHPHDAESFNPEVEAWIRKHANEPEVVAIGETGLDYYRNDAPRDVQIAAFRAQMQLAADFGLPVEIHTRDAEDDTKVILQEFKGRVKGLLHCFTGTWDLAKAGLDAGFNISISGVVTFKNAEPLREVVQKLPLDRLHVETDAPFLAPAPHRGKTNHPGWIVHTAQTVADLHKISLETLSQHQRRNAQQLFDKLPR